MTFFSNALISLTGAKDKRKQIITQRDLYKELEVTNVIPNGTLRPACPRGVAGTILLESLASEQRSSAVKFRLLWT